MIHVTLVPHRPGTFVNHVVLGTSSPDASYSRDGASATVRVTRVSREAAAEHVPSFTG